MWELLRRVRDSPGMAGKSHHSAAEPQARQILLPPRPFDLSLRALRETEGRDQNDMPRDRDAQPRVGVCEKRLAQASAAEAGLKLLGLRHGSSRALTA